MLKVIPNVTLFPRHRYFTLHFPLKLTAFLTSLECVLNVVFQLLSKQAIIHVQGGVGIILSLLSTPVWVYYFGFYSAGLARIHLKVFLFSRNWPLILKKKINYESLCSKSAEIILILCKVVVCISVLLG